MPQFRAASRAAAAYMAEFLNEDLAGNGLAAKAEGVWVVIPESAIDYLRQTRTPDDDGYIDADRQLWWGGYGYQITTTGHSRSRSGQRMSLRQVNSGRSTIWYTPGGAWSFTNHDLAVIDPDWDPDEPIMPEQVELFVDDLNARKPWLEE